jgi:hypothetical protein
MTLELLMDTYTANTINQMLEQAHLNPGVIILSGIIIAVIVYYYILYRDNIDKVKYTLICLFIIFNIPAITSLFTGIIKVNTTFRGKSYLQSIDILETKDLYLFYSLLNKEISTTSTFFVAVNEECENNENNESYLHRIIYFLTPRKMVKSVQQADYIILIGYSRPEIFKLFSHTGELIYYSPLFSLIKRHSQPKGARA